MAPEAQNLVKRRGRRGLYVSMLSEDFGNRHYAYEMGLDFDGVDYETGDDIVTGLLHEVSQYRRESATRLFPQLISRVVSDHLNSGRCMFELFGDSHNESPGPRLGILPAWSLRHRRGRTLQAIPRAGDLEWRTLPTAALVEFRLPGKYGKELYRTAKRLQAVDARPLGDPALVFGAAAAGYDFNTHRNTLDEMAARATRFIGWDGRRAFLGRATDSYRTYRSLRFLRTWLTIVSAVTETMNVICNRPEVTTRRPFKMRVTGLPTIQDVERSMVAVISGTESLGDIFNHILHPRRS